MFELRTNYLNHKRVHPHLGVIVNNKKFITLNPLTEHVSIFRRHYQASECQTFVSMNFDRLTFICEFKRWNTRYISDSNVRISVVSQVHVRVINISGLVTICVIRLMIITYTRNRLISDYALGSCLEVQKTRRY